MDLKRSMKILALDSTETASTVAITDGTVLMAQSKINIGRSHSETLLPMVQMLLSGASISFDEIDVYACSTGPGSFTGVRIGAATVKGLAFGKGKPCIGVSALEALAYNFSNIDGIICPCMDARRNQLYNAIFESRNGKITRLCEDRVISSIALSEELLSCKGPIWLCGGGYEIIKKACVGNENVKITPELLKSESAYSVALCAYNSMKNGLDINACTDKSLVPVYLRPSQAERMRNGESS